MPCLPQQGERLIKNATIDIESRHCPEHTAHEAACKKCRKAVQNARQRAKAKVAPPPPPPPPAPAPSRARPRKGNDLPSRVLAARIPHATFDSLKARCAALGVPMIEIILEGAQIALAARESA